MSSGAPSEPTPADQRIDRLSPEALVESFSRSHLLRWFLVALAAHLLLIGAFSIGTIRDMLDPEGAAPQTPIERATSEVAKPDEIPTAPDDLGIGIDDTNPQ